MQKTSKPQAPATAPSKDAAPADTCDSTGACDSTSACDLPLVDKEKKEALVESDPK